LSTDDCGPAALQAFEAFEHENKGFVLAVALKPVLAALGIPVYAFYFTNDCNQSTWMLNNKSIMTDYSSLNCCVHVGGTGKLSGSSVP